VYPETSTRLEGIMRRWFVVVVLFISASLTSGPVLALEAEHRVFELRTYTTHEGRLAALEARFRDHTMRLFEKHGMQNVGYWIPDDKPNTLIYIIVHENGAAVTENWRAFGDDPEWRAVATQSRKDGPILVEGGIQSRFLHATDYSPLK